MSERLGLLAVQERHARRVYEGQPVKLLDTNVSLPPPPPPQSTPPKAPPTQKVSSLPMADRRHMVRAVTAEGKTKWKLSAEALAEVRRRIAACDSLGNIARSMRLSPATVSKIARSIRAASAAAPAPACEATDPLRVLPYEPARTHILDWGRRMAGYEFSTMSEACRPKKGPSHSKGYTADQMNNVIRSTRPPTAGMSINTKPAPVQSQIAVQSIAQLFGGGGGC